MGNIIWLVCVVQGDFVTGDKEARDDTFSAAIRAFFYRTMDIIWIIVAARDDKI